MATSNRKVRVVLAVDIDLDSWSEISPSKAAKHVQSRITAFQYPVGMTVTSADIVEVLVKNKRRGTSA